MTGQDNDRTDKASLEEQMKSLLAGIEEEPVPGELRTLADELQAALSRRRAAAKSQK